MIFFLLTSWPSAYDRLYITRRDKQSQEFCPDENHSCTLRVCKKNPKQELQNPIYGQCEGRWQAVIPISRITLNMTNLFPHFRLIRNWSQSWLGKLQLFGEGQTGCLLSWSYSCKRAWCFFFFLYSRAESYWKRAHTESSWRCCVFHNLHSSQRRRLVQTSAGFDLTEQLKPT